MMRFGLKQDSIEAIIGCFARYSKVEKVIIYGSRAKGNFHVGSDIDLTIVGDDISLSDLFEMEITLDDLLLPSKIDLSVLLHIHNHELLNHIERVGVVFWDRDQRIVE